MNGMYYIHHVVIVMETSVSSLCCTHS